AEAVFVGFAFVALRFLFFDRGRVVRAVAFVAPGVEAHGGARWQQDVEDRAHALGQVVSRYERFELRADLEVGEAGERFDFVNFVRVQRSWVGAARFGVGVGVRVGAAESRAAERRRVGGVGVLRLQRADVGQR